MKSINFEFLRAHHPTLSDLGGLAEHYAHTDPAASLVKARMMLEAVVGYIYFRHKLPKPYTLKSVGEPSLDEMLQGPDFTKIVPQPVRFLLQSARKASNAGAHVAGLSAVTTRVALDALRGLWDVTRWLYEFAGWGKASGVAAWANVPPGGAVAETKGLLQQQKKEALQKAAEAEAQLKETLAALDAERQKTAEAQKLVALTQAELDALLAEAQKAADTLKLDETRTRRAVIDQLLAQAGWKVGEGGAATEEVGQEVRLRGYASKSGSGFADYVLYGVDGKALAVIEAKRAALDMEKGRTQAGLYADALEKEHGQRPVIYYTNGLELALWDDAQRMPPRTVYGFRSRDGLAWLVQQRATRRPFTAVPINAATAGRMYQLEAIQRVCERFEQNHRRALLVLATGTGKTRVAIALCERLLGAGMARRILFLCDRRELRKQALNAFKAYLPDEPRVVIDGDLDDDDRAKNRVFLATYPAMMKCYAAFETGFFDVLIADESHRSIYNRYRDLFVYFDARQVGLTATPVKFVERNTYRLFGCEDKLPTAAFSLDEAIEHQPPYLVPPAVVKVDTKFLREGVRYSQMTEVQRAQIEADQEDPEAVEYDAADTDRKVYNRDTQVRILRNLMEHGLRDATGTLPGKSIVFARNHTHAKILEEVFRSLYPDLGGHFCRVIDNHEPLADKLIDNFKTRANPLTVAISVDMLDTGIDVPEVVNLVFAKPVRSYVKFWQMIGRGTRLCPNLFGAGKHKTRFMIFDHWDNFGYFEEEREEEEPSVTKSLLQQVFEARLDLCELAQTRADEAVFKRALALVTADLNDLLACRSVSVQERRAELLTVARPESLTAFAGVTRHTLRDVAAPLMQWRPLGGEEDAWRFDLLVTRAQCELVRASSRFADLRDDVIESVSRLLYQHADVQARGETIARVARKSFWDAVTVADLDAVRDELRGVMKHRQEDETPRAPPRVIDVTDEDERREEVLPRLEGLDLVLYRERVQRVLREHFATEPVLVKIRRGEPVAEGDLRALCDLVVGVDDKANIYRLAGRDPDLRTALAATLRALVGMDAAAVDRGFTAFVTSHPKLSARQMQFLQLLKSHVVTHGGLTLAKLYEAPFTTLHAEGIDGVFAANERDEILAIVRPFVVEEAS
jgi:type I restriction enzyme R subunit